GLAEPLQPPPEDVRPLLLHLAEPRVVLATELRLEERQLPANRLPVGDAQVAAVVVQRGEQAEESGEERSKLRLSRGGQHPSAGELPVVLEDRVAQIAQHEVVLALALGQLRQQTL